METNASKKLNGSWLFVDVVPSPESSLVYVDDGALEEGDAVEEDMMFVSSLSAVLRSEGVYSHKSGAEAGSHI